MSQSPPLKLSVLRDIGWQHWDPIGILAAGETWAEHPAADEYDQYLIAVAGGLRRGWTRARSIEKLLSATEDMGLSSGVAATARAEATVDAVQAYLDDEKRAQTADPG